MPAAGWAAVRLLGGAVIIALLLWRLGGAPFVAGLRLVDAPSLLMAAAIGLLTTIVSAGRWCLVARGLGIRLPLRDAVADYYRALFLNAALPGGVLGDVHRAVRHGRDVGDLGRGVRAVVLERTAGQLTLAAVTAVVLLVGPSPVRPDADLLTAPGTWAVVLVTGAVVAGVRYRLRRRGVSWWRRAVRTAGRDIRLGLLARWPAIVLTSAVILAGHVATFLLAARVAGSPAPIGQLVPLLLLALLAMAVPLNIAGWGPREGVAAWAFGAAGLGAGLGLTTAVVYGLFAFVASLPGAGVLLARWAVRVRAGRVGTRPPTGPGDGPGVPPTGPGHGPAVPPTGPGHGPAVPPTAPGHGPGPPPDASPGATAAARRRAG